ncbi:MAG TPA: hypothetical protein VFQ22_00050, partial [Longimicrobiales bacterium]|nr:hypothetical protein [Longimicrobiales bacterium]
VAELRGVHEAFGPDVRDVFDWQASTDARDVPGGTSLGSVRAQLSEAATRVASLEAWAQAPTGAASSRPDAAANARSDSIS